MVTKTERKNLEYKAEIWIEEYDQVVYLGVYKTEKQAARIALEVAKNYGQFLTVSAYTRKCFTETEGERTKFFEFLHYVPNGTFRNGNEK